MRLNRPARYAGGQKGNFMGDRGNIVVKSGNQQVWFYTHWSGSNIAQVVKTALAKKWRWDDSLYLARIIFCELVKGAEDHETGFGISCRISDNEHDIIVVDTDAQKVGFIKEIALENGQLPVDFKLSKLKTFAAFIA